MSGTYRSLHGLVLVLAACGGTSSSTTTTPSPPPPADSANAATTSTTPFDPATVQRSVAAMAVPEVCGTPEDAATLGELFQKRTAELGDPSTLDTSFTCRPHGSEPDLWECVWATETKPTAPTADDPCGGAGGSGFFIIMPVDAAGAVDAGEIICNAPG